MNINSAPMYNTELTAMRNPSAHTDVLKKLVFMYPMGIDQSLVNAPFNTFVKGDNDTIGDLCRSFLTISVLKEIFTSNALNLITTASTYRDQINQNPVRQALGSLLRGESENPITNYSTANYPQLNPMDKNVLQTKVTEKVKVIKAELKSNPRLRKLNPFMQVITLQNLLDVPVVVGTWPFQLDTTVLFAVLAIAMRLRVKLSDTQSIHNIFNKLQSYDDLNLYQILTVFDNLNNNNDKVKSRVAVRNIPGSSPDRLTILRNKISNEKPDNIKKIEQYQKRYNEELNAYAIKNIADLKDNRIKQTEIMFNLLVDPVKLATKYGLSNEFSQSTYVSKKVSPQTDLLFNRTRSQFMDFVSGCDGILSSIYNLFSPMIPEVNSGWDASHGYIPMKKKLLDTIYSNFDELFDKLKNEFDKNISKCIIEAGMSIKAMRSSCDGTKEDFISLVANINKMMGDTQVPATFGFSDVQRFSESLDRLIGKFLPVSDNVLNDLVSFFGEDITNIIKSNIITFVNNALSNFFDKLSVTNQYGTNMQAKIFAINHDLQNYNTHDITTGFVNGNFPDQGAMFDKQTANTMYSSMMNASREALTTIFKTMFLLIFRMNICDFVEVADVEFDTAQADVLDLPNFCLVLPIEIVNALLTLQIKRNWQDAVVASGVGFNPLNTGNTKGTINNIAEQLGIPNLMVVDRKRGELYYCFAYLGHRTEKIKLQAADTFIKSHLQGSDAEVSQVYY